MSKRTYCDCGCGKQLTGYDAGRGPVMLRSRSGVVLQVNVLTGPNHDRPAIQVSCVRKLLADGEIVWPLPHTGAALEVLRNDDNHEDDDEEEVA